MGDWRLDVLQTREYLFGVRFKRKSYRVYRSDWRHDHCVSCGITFAEDESDREPIMHEGFATTADYEYGEDYEWVCAECFALFRDAMGWTEVRL